MSKEECCQVNKKDAEYLCERIGDCLLQEGKGKLLNIIEGCGLQEKQEQAVKRLIVDWLHDQDRFLVSVVNNLSDYIVPTPKDINEQDITKLTEEKLDSSGYHCITDKMMNNIKGHWVTSIDDRGYATAHIE